MIFRKGRPEDAIAYTFVSYWIYLPPVLASFMLASFIFAIIIYVKWKDDLLPVSRQ